MGGTGANMAHWASLYTSGGAGGGGAPAATEATVVTAAAAAGTVSSPTSGGSAGSPTRAQTQPGVESGRVGKPARRRSRASRRAPVTLLNTDTSNFRAMVQQFTGIPSGPYGPAGAGAGGGPVISFGGGGAGGDYGGAALVRPSPTSAVMSFDHLAAAAQHHRPPTSLQAQLFRPQQQYGGAGAGGDVGYGMHGGGGGDMAPFMHGFESSAEDRLLLQSIQAAQMMPTRPSSTSNGNGYNFG
ncbi:unnamed protein product [Urochloa decumbens]|uniref:VQ domain-containing protein n=1 Tax=Urochloa decumbens TaxID=240449 RepID=A0ABC9A213_9POAL